MKTECQHLIAAGALLLVTAAAGVAARGRTAIFPVPTNGKVTFAAPATGTVSFTGTLDRGAVLLGHDGIARMELVIAAAPDKAAAAVRRATDVVIILDRSGSMGGEKIEHARAAIRELLTQLGPQDRFALVTYSDTAAVTIPPSSVDNQTRTAWLGTIAEIQPNGGTNMASGLDLGIDLIERSRTAGSVPHVVLISDGLANQGDATPEGLTRRARRAAQGEYMLSTVGVGTDFNEYLMTALADAGTGNYYYLRNAEDLASVFARELDAARTTVASALAVQIAPARGVRVVDAAGYPLELAGDTVVFRPGSLFAGQERRIWVTLAVPHEAVGEYDLGRFSVAYGDGDHRTTLSFADAPRIACVQGEDQFYANVDVPAWSRSVVVDAYNKMQDEVAREVQAGRRDAARGAIARYKAETAAMNARLQSAPVAAQLHAADKLEGQVADAFQGADQAQRQNELSKETSAQALDARRAGSKK
jgi:Ca-activated chloride channel homolog